MFFWLSFVAWDYVLHGTLEVFPALVAIRFLFGGIWLIALNIAIRQTFAKTETAASTIMALAVLGVWIGLLWMVRLTDPYEAFAQYIPGFALVLFFHYTLSRHRWVTATIWGIFYALLFNVNQYYIWSTGRDVRVVDNWISASLYFIGFIVMGGVISYQLEWYHWNEQRAKDQLLAQNDELIASRLAEQEAKLRVTAAANDKAQFLVQASHDMRQPMQSIGLFVNLLQSRILHGEAKGLLNNLERSVRSMDDLFRSMLDINRLDAGTMSINLQDIYLPAVLEDLAEQCRPIAEAKGLQLRLHNLDGIWIASDPTLLRRIIRNLLLNAIQYTIAGGIILAARNKRGKVQVQVWDSGIGVASDQQQNIFKPYLQLPKNRIIRKKGLGLGLAIARGMADLVEAKLSVCSVPSKGSIFTFELAVAQPAPLPAPEVSASPIELDIGILNTLPIAIVENEQDVLAGLEALIKTHGGHPITARGTDLLVQTLAANNIAPRLLVADIELEGDDTAWDTMEALKERLGYVIPMVLITGSVTIEHREKAKRLGIAVIQKPFDPNILIATMVQTLKEEAHQGRPGAES